MAYVLWVPWHPFWLLGPGVFYLDTLGVALAPVWHTFYLFLIVLLVVQLAMKLIAFLPAFQGWLKPLKLGTDLLGIVASAIAEHGDRTVQLPAAPPPMRFSEPEECRRVLAAQGFEKVAVDRIDIAWRSDRAEALLELIYGGAVRAAMLLEAQEPAARAKIHDAIIAAARARNASDTIIIRRPTVMARGEKP